MSEKKRQKGKRHDSNICWDWEKRGKCTREKCKWNHNMPNNRMLRKVSEAEKEQHRMYIRKVFKNVWPEKRLQEFESALRDDPSIGPINLNLLETFTKAEGLPPHALAAELFRVLNNDLSKYVGKSKNGKEKIWFEYEKPLYRCLKKFFENPKELESQELCERLTAILLLVNPNRFTKEQREKLEEWRRVVDEKTIDTGLNSSITMDISSTSVFHSVTSAHPPQDPESGPYTPSSSESNEEENAPPYRAPSKRTQSSEPNEILSPSKKQTSEKQAAPNTDEDSDSNSFKEQPEIELSLLKSELGQHCNSERIQVVLKDEIADAWLKNFKKIIDRFVELEPQDFSSLTSSKQVENLKSTIKDLCGILEIVFQEPSVAEAMSYSQKLLMFLSSLEIDGVNKIIDEFQKRASVKKSRIENPSPELPQELLDKMPKEDNYDYFSSKHRKRKRTDLTPKMLKLMKNTAFKLLRAFPGLGIQAESIRAAICRACQVNMSYNEIENSLAGYIQSRNSNGRRMVRLHPSVVKQMYKNLEFTRLFQLEKDEMVVFCDFPAQKETFTEESVALRGIFVRINGVIRVICGVITETSIPLGIVVNTRDMVRRVRTVVCHYRVGEKKVKIRTIIRRDELCEALCGNHDDPSKIRVLPNANFIQRVSNGIDIHHRGLQPSKRIVTQRQRLLNDKLTPMLKRIAKKLKQNAYFEVFGSTANGLDTINSDLDLSIHLQDKDGNELPIIDPGTAKSLLKLMAKQMNNQGYRDVTPVLVARVPIVKFKDKDSDIECDISIRNSLSRFKTRLLKMFICADERVKPLILAVKHWAKARDIGDAARGSLNMFGYTLLVIQFLQCIEPSILPAVVCPASWDEKIPWLSDPQCHKGFGKKNEMQLGELLISFFEFYRRFNFEDGAISVRNGRPLLKNLVHSQPGHRRCMIIEDPFDNSDNCARNITEGTLRNIRQEFVRAYALLATARYSMSELCNTKNKNGSITQPRLMYSPHRSPLKKPRLQVSPVRRGIHSPVSQLMNTNLLVHQFQGSIPPPMPGSRLKGPPVPNNRIPYGQPMPRDLRAFNKSLKNIPPQLTHILGFPRKPPPHHKKHTNSKRERQQNSSILDILQNSPVPNFPRPPSGKKPENPTKNPQVCTFIFPRKQSRNEPEKMVLPVPSTMPFVREAKLPQGIVPELIPKQFRKKHR